MIDLRVNVLEAFNLDFCARLEYHLTKALGSADDNLLKYIWCDGIEIPSIYEQFTVENIGSIKSISTMCRLGFTGQDRYQMTIKLGQCARLKCLKGQDLKDCLPDSSLIEWVTLDMENFTVELRLK
jgi:hypothetical protein